MVQQDGEVLQLNVRVGDFAINDVSSIRATDSGSTGTFENGDRIGIIVLDADNNVLSDNIPYRYDGNIWSFDSNNDEGKTTIYYDNKATVYLAYFPYSKEADNVINIDDLKVNSYRRVTNAARMPTVLPICWYGVTRVVDR